jgi:hypothetical protein
MRCPLKRYALRTDSGWQCFEAGPSHTRRRSFSRRGERFLEDDTRSTSRQSEPVLWEAKERGHAQIMAAQRCAAPANYAVFRMNPNGLLHPFALRMGPRFWFPVLGKQKTVEIFRKAVVSLTRICMNNHCQLLTGEMSIFAPIMRKHSGKSYKFREHFDLTRSLKDNCF